MEEKLHHAPMRSALDLLPPAAVRLLNTAAGALGRGQINEAEHALLGALALAPDCAEANRLMGVVSQMRGDYASAVGFLRHALAANQNDPTTHMNLGSALFETGATDAALTSLRRACELAPKLAAGWYNLGKALKLNLQYQAACEALQKALKIDPAHVLSRMSLADAQTGLGHIEDAIANYREVLRRQPELAQAWFSLSNLKTEPFTPAEVVGLQRALRRHDAPSEGRTKLGFALAKALEDQAQYPVAFKMLQQANSWKRQTVKWNAAMEHARVDSIMQAFSGHIPAPLDAELGHQVIFIVSLPRSGSTLTEQILAAHLHVEGANEITDLPQVIEDESNRRGKPFPTWVAEATREDWVRLGRDYLARTERWHVGGQRFTDKNLVTWQLVGAIRSMLPGARIINCHREPVETCLACYRQLFSNGAHFSYDLTEMADYYNDYSRLTRHWHEVFPQRIFDHSHEALLADPETHIRALLNFCGLPFDAACLSPHLSSRTVRSTASAAQVRQPLQAKPPYALKFGDLLQPLRGYLQPFDNPQADDN